MALLAVAAVIVVCAVAVGPAWAAQGESPLQLKRWLNAIWAVGLFVLLLIILGRYAWKPVIRAMQAREQALADIVAETERRRSDGEEMLVEYRSRLSAAEEEVAAMLERSRQEAEITREDIVKHAKKQAAASIAEAQRQILLAKQEALGEIYRNTADLATRVASKIVKKEISAEDHDRLVDESLKRLENEIG